MEWRDLLVKYMALVLKEEGSDFLYRSRGFFDNMELCALNDAAEEAEALWLNS